MTVPVQRFLAETGVAFKIHPHPPSVSFEDAKVLLPFDPASMVKALAFHLPDGRYALVALRAADRADYKKIADALGIRRADLRMATTSELSVELDMQVGGITPLPLKGAIVLLDQSILQLDVIICGTGRNDASLEIAARDLVRVAGGDVGNYAKDA
jgi:Cys-tRNA(Pro)/Cys-tRNA(Cys) deacylase